MNWRRTQADLRIRGVRILFLFVSDLTAKLSRRDDAYELPEVCRLLGYPVGLRQVADLVVGGWLIDQFDFAELS